jgi:hypothetical protein
VDQSELVDYLEGCTRRAGVRPVLALLVDWIGRGFFQEIMENAADNWPEGVSQR